MYGACISINLSLSLSLSLYIYIYICVCVYIYIYIYFSPVEKNGFSLETEWQQVLSGLQESSQYPTWSQQCWSFDYFFLWSTILPGCFTLGNVPSAPTTTDTTVIFMFHGGFFFFFFFFFFCFRPKSNYFSWVYSLINWNSRIDEMTIYFFLIFNTRSS